MAKEKKKEEKSVSSKKTKASSSDVENGKVCAALAYLLIGIIWYFVDEKMKKNKFANFHVKQGLVLLIVSLGGSIILGIIVFIGWILMPIWNLLMLVLFILGLINAFSGKEKELPVIGQFAKHFKF